MSHSNKLLNLRPWKPLNLLLLAGWPAGGPGTPKTCSWHLKWGQYYGRLWGLHILNSVTGELQYTQLGWKQNKFFNKGYSGYNMNVVAGHGNFYLVRLPSKVLKLPSSVFHCQCHLPKQNQLFIQTSEVASSTSLPTKLSHPLIYSGNNIIWLRLPQLKVQTPHNLLQRLNAVVPACLSKPWLTLHSYLILGPTNTGF